MKLYEIGVGVFAIAAAMAGCGESESGDGDGDGSGGSTAGTSTTGSGGASGSAGSTGKGGTTGGSGGTTAGGGTTGAGGTTGIICDPAAIALVATMGSGCAAYDDCIEAACGTTIAQCLGQNWESGDFTGGTCETTIGCIQECDCEETCSTACYTNDIACTLCGAAMLNCSAGCEDEQMACP